MSASIYIYTAVSIYLSVCIYTDISIFMYLYIHIFTYLSIPMPVYRDLYIYVYISVHFRSLSTVSVYFYISLYLYPYIISFRIISVGMCRATGQAYRVFIFSAILVIFGSFLPHPARATPPLFAGEFWKHRKRKKSRE